MPTFIALMRKQLQRKKEKNPAIYKKRCSFPVGEMLRSPKSIAALAQQFMSFQYFTIVKRNMSNFSKTAKALKGNQCLKILLFFSLPEITERIPL